MNEDPETPPSDDDVRAEPNDASPFLQEARSAAAELPASREPMIFAVAQWARVARQPDDIHQLFGVCEMAVSIMTQHAQGERFPTLGASLDLRLSLAIVLDMGGQWSLSIALLEPAVRDLEALMADYPDNVSPMLARLLGRQGQAWMRQHQPEEALPRLERALTLYRIAAERGLAVPPETMANLLLDGGVALIRASRVREAADWFGEAGRFYLELLTHPEIEPEWPRRAVSAFLNQTQALRETERHAEATQPLRQAWTVLAQAAAAGEQPADLRRAFWQAESLAKTFAAWGDLARRAPALEIAVAVGEALAMADPDGMAAKLAWLTTHWGANQLALGNFVGGALTLQRGCALYRRLVDAQTGGDIELGTAFVDALRLTASALNAAGRHDDGLVSIDEAIDVLGRLKGQGHRLTALSISVRLVAARLRWQLRGAMAIDALLARVGDDFEQARSEGIPFEADHWANYKMLQGFVLLETSRAADARHAFEECLASLPPPPSNPSGALIAPMTTLVEVAHATALAATGEIDRAGRQFEQALATESNASSPLSPFVRAWAKMGLARVLLGKGRLRECARLSMEAGQELREQAGSYQLQMMQIEAATLLGTALVVDGAQAGLHQAGVMLQQAADLLIDWIKLGHTRLLPTLHITQVLQSHLLVERGHTATAIDILSSTAQALRDAPTLTATQGTWYSFALTALGEARYAVEGCSDAVLAIVSEGIAVDALLAERFALKHHRDMGALRHLMLAERLAQSGRAEQARGHEDHAAGILFSVIDSGDWLNPGLLITSVARLVPRWWQDVVDGAQDASPSMSMLTRVAASLRQTHVDDRLVGSELGRMMQMHVELLAQLQTSQLQPTSIPRDLASVYESLLSTALSWMRVLLRDSDPPWLHANREAIDRQLGSLQRTALVIGSSAVARWFLCTQGLRAQRAALHESRDRALTGLKQCWDEIDRLSRLQMGAPHAAGSPIAMLMPTRHLIAQPLNAPADSLQTLLAEAMTQKDRLQQELEFQGRIVVDSALELEEIHARLRPGQALLLLAPLGNSASPGDGVAIVLRSAQDVADPVQARRLTIDPGGLVVEPGMRDAVDSTARGRRLRQLRQRTMPAAGEVVERPGANESLGEDGVPTSRTSAWAAASGLPADPDWASEDAALPEWLSELRRQGVRELAVVPSGSWHSVPWGQLLSRQALRTHLLPSVGAWWRLTATLPANSIGYNPPRRSRRVALLPHDARHASEAAAWLPWVAVEAVLARRLWPVADSVLLRAEDPTWLPDDAALRIHTLVGMGHGHGQAENPASAGLWLGSDEQHAPRLLNAQNLGHIAQVRVLVLSCCVLGRTEARFGEPMGMAADAFAHGVRIALGALIPLPDLDAMLLSLACQWAMRVKDPEGVRTHTVLHEALSTLRQGTWPSGFGEWLHTHMAGAVCQVMDDRETTDDFAQTLWRCALAEADCLGLDLACWQRPSIDDAGLASLAEALSASPPASTRQAAGWLVLLGSDPLEDEAPQ